MYEPQSQGCQKIYQPEVQVRALAVDVHDVVERVDRDTVADALNAGEVLHLGLRLLGGTTSSSAGKQQQEHEQQEASSTIHPTMARCRNDHFFRLLKCSKLLTC